MNTRDLRMLAGKRESDRRAETAAANIAGIAAEQGLLDVALGVFESPVGELLLAVTPRGLAYVAFEEEERDELLGRFSRQLSPRILEYASDGLRFRLGAFKVAPARTYRGGKERARRALPRRVRPRPCSGRAPRRWGASDVRGETTCLPDGPSSPRAQRET